MSDEFAFTSLAPEEFARWEADRQAFAAPVEWADWDDEDRIQDARDRLAILRRWSRQFAALGVDVEAVAGRLEVLLQDLIRTVADVEAAVEQQLHASADLADANTALFKALANAVDEAGAERPFDPEVQEFREMLEVWRQHLPKDLSDD